MAIKGYKAFDRGMTCRGKQYAEHTVFEECGATECCQAGVMHYCENPLDVLEYYPLVDYEADFSEIAEVEPLGEVLRERNKCATSKLKICGKLSLNAFIDVIFHAKLGVDDANNRAHAHVVNCRSYRHIINEGLSAYVSNSGDQPILVNRGYYARIANIGNSAKILNSAHSAQIINGAPYSQIANSGDSVNISSSGNYDIISSSGSTTVIMSSGHLAKLASHGPRSVVVGIGEKTIAKAALGDWIVLAEWKKDANNSYHPKCVKAAQVDGVNIKADTWYKLVDEEFIEVDN